MTVSAGERQNELFPTGHSIGMAVFQADDRDKRRLTDDDRQRNTVAQSGVRFEEQEKQTEAKRSGKRRIDEKLAYGNFQERQAIVDLRCVQKTFLQTYRKKTRWVHRSKKLEIH